MHNFPFDTWLQLILRLIPREAIFPYWIVKTLPCGCWKYSAFFVRILTITCSNRCVTKQQTTAFSCCQILKLLLGPLKVNIIHRDLAQRFLTVLYQLGKFYPKGSLDTKVIMCQSVQWAKAKYFPINSLLLKSTNTKIYNPTLLTREAENLLSPSGGFFVLFWLFFWLGFVCLFVSKFKLLFLSFTEIIGYSERKKLWTFSKDTATKKRI